MKAMPRYLGFTLLPLCALLTGIAWGRAPLPAPIPTSECPLVSDAALLETVQGSKITTRFIDEAFGCVWSVDGKTFSLFLKRHENEQDAFQSLNDLEEAVKKDKIQKK